MARSRLDILDGDRTQRQTQGSVRKDRPKADEYRILVHHHRRRSSSVPIFWRQHVLANLISRVETK